jgi:enhancing lycopene biosynthesis protein 2
MSKKKIAVVLAGCGVFDGAEIHEATFTMLSVAKQGAYYECFAPNIKQAHVINHITGKEMPETRNVMVEAARISRGKIKPLNDFNSFDFDAVVFPGGFGAAKNLCSFAFDGIDCLVNPDVEKVVKSMVEAGKPIGALCISPVIIAKILGDVTLTIGHDKGTAQALENLGAIHKKTTHGEVIIDEKYKVVTTPCYMLDAKIDQIADGADNIIRIILGMVD